MASSDDAKELARRGLVLCAPLLIAPASKELPGGKKAAALKARAEKQLDDDPEAGLETAMLAVAEALRLSGGEESLKSHFGEALKIGKAAATLFQSSGRTSGEACALLLSAAAQLVKKRPDLSVPAARQALSLHRSKSDALGEAAAFIALGEAYLLAGEKTKLAIANLHDHVSKSRREGLNDSQNQSLADAQAAAEEAVEATRRAGDRKEEACALILLAQVHFSKKDCIEADNQARASAELARQRGDEEWQAFANTIIIHACIMNGDILEALDVAEESVEMQHNSKNQYCEAVAMMEVAKIYAKLGEEPGVVKWSKKAQAAFKGLGKLKEQVASKHTLLCHFVSAKKFEDAETVARDSESLYRQARDRGGETMAMHWRAQVQILGFYDTFGPKMEEQYEWELSRGVRGKEHKDVDLKPYEEAIETTNKCFEIFKELGDEVGMAAVAETAKSAQEKSEEMAKKICEPSSTIVMRAGQPIQPNKTLMKEVKLWEPKGVDKNEAEEGASEQGASA